MKRATKHSMAETMRSIRTTYQECNKLMEDIRHLTFGRYGED